MSDNGTSRTAPKGFEVFRRPARRVALCGTRAGYNRHLHLKEKPCEDCTAANTVAAREYRRRV